MMRNRPTLLITCIIALSACSRPAADRRRADPTAPLPIRMAAADASAGARLFRWCAACHTASEGAGDRDGPNLYGVLGRPIGRGSGRFGYTAALQAKRGVWTAEKLDAWLANPQRFAPGTSMMFPGLPDGMDRADVIAYLATQGSPGTDTPPRSALQAAAGQRQH